MDTKTKGDIAEQSAILAALKMGWGVAKPIGDRLPYDLIFDVGGRLVKAQVKSAWFDKKSNNFMCDNRRSKTNRKHYKFDRYEKGDFDFAVVFIEGLELFYVLPFDVFMSYKGVIHFVVAPKRQRSIKTEMYRNAWNLIQEWGAPGETQVVIPAKFGEACDVVIPSQASDKRKV